MSHYVYDQVPYSSHAYWQSAPDNLATLATLFGLQPAPPGRCRVLEVGCASGGNLAPQAVLHSGSTFVGFDLSEVQIDNGNRMIAPLGLSNLELRRLDLMEAGASLGEFDYIVAHGVYSWVSDAARDRLLALCRDHLAPHGVAYVSYNTFPGWHMRGMIRDMMVYHTAPIPDPERKVQQARALLMFLARAHSGTTPSPYAAMLHTEAETLTKMSDTYLLHDHLSEHNDPVYFHQFIDKVVSHGMAYLGEARLPMMMQDRMPDSVRDVFRQIAHDQVKVEQYMDFVRNRMFRESLLVHAGVDVDRKLDWRRMRPYRFGCRGRRDGTVIKVRDDEVSTSDALALAAFDVMIEAWPKSVPFEDLLAAARDRCGSEAPLHDDRKELGGGLLQCFTNGVVDVRLTELPVTADVERPKVFPWARIQVASGLTRLTNARHESGDSDDLMRTIFMLCDGERDHDEIVDALADIAEQGALVVWDEGRKVTDRGELRRAFSNVLPDALNTAVNMSMVVE